MSGFLKLAGSFEPSPELEGRLKRAAEERAAEEKATNESRAKAKADAIEAEIGKLLGRDGSAPRTDLPAAALSCIDAGIRDTAAVAIVREGVHGAVVLSGGAGSGKTVAAAWWVVSFLRNPDRWRQGLDEHEVKWRGMLPEFVTAAHLARWERYSDAEMNRLLHSPALVIDDLGVEFSDRGGSFQATLDEVINARYGAELPTVITTNLDGAAFKARYGERIADRIRQTGKFCNVTAAKSLRRTP